MKPEEIEKKAEEYGSQRVWQDRTSFEDGAKWVNAEWQEKTRWIPVDEKLPELKEHGYSVEVMYLSEDK